MFAIQCSKIISLSITNLCTVFWCLIRQYWHWKVTKGCHFQYRHKASFT